MQALVAKVMDKRLIDLLDLWRAAGPIADPSARFSAHADHLLVIDIDTAGNRYTHYGRAFVRHFGADLAGCVIDRLPADILPADRRGMLDFDYAYARRVRRPLWRSYTAMFDNGAQEETWQRLVLPAGGDRLVVGAYPVMVRHHEDPGAELLRMVLDRVPVVLNDDDGIDDLALSLRAFCDHQIHLAELEWRATRDSLTGIANRAHFHHLAGMELDHARRMGRPFTVLALDLDHFKRINDRWGHATGDTALRAFVTACRQALREGDILGRIGGEEFAIALPGTGGEGARLIAERLRQQVEQVVLRTESGETCAMTVSIGVVSWTERAPASVSPDDIAAMLNRADTALYRAKDGGRNRVEVAPEE
ncbi:GGDEF domain-containing protein [Magnetospirillum molischianum]|uniref:diguanylate cyclase n=1 Tax=Magnetospirillum molischianum DSM 120 TaxID=1150626 RepID=H8FX15_MAGML|nr:GGDEF domain-containing protein [Magnetospirillum molischianum]CCG42903.1 Response regulator containing a CheY-like receiver domain and a GGDEF domain [Magnetospirillum molischianum DSM 120]